MLPARMTPCRMHHKHTTPAATSTLSTGCQASFEYAGTGNAQSTRPHWAAQADVPLCNSKLGPATQTSHINSHHATKCHMPPSICIRCNKLDGANLRATVCMKPDPATTTTPGCFEAHGSAVPLTPCTGQCTWQWVRCYHPDEPMLG